MATLRWESRIGAIDAAVLIGGVAALLLWYPPAVVGFALAHLLCGFLAAPSKAFWAATSVALLLIQIGVTWLAWRFVPSPLFAQLGEEAPEWLTLSGAAVIIFGACGAILSAAGNNDRLANHIERVRETTTRATN